VKSAVLAVLAGVLAITACGADGGPSSNTPQECRTDGTASLCLRSEGGVDFNVVGSGFRPRSDVRLDMDGGAGQLLPVDSLGNFPAGGGAVGFLPGPAAEVHRLEGVDGTGQPVTFVVTCRITTGKQPRCTF
jgi:hypothetical protein